MPTELIPSVLVVVAGVSLAVVAGARLASRALPSMPRSVAMAGLAAAVGVIGIGVALGALRPAEQAKSIDLEPAPSAGLAPTPEPDGVISGTVKLAGDAPLGGAVVTLRRFERTDQVGTQTTSTAADGSYRFERLPVGPEVAYTTSAEYAGTTFRSGLLFPGMKSQQVSASLVVAESAEDPSTIEYAVDSVVVIGDSRGLQVLHILDIRNSSDRAYVGGIRLPVLPGATQLDARTGLDRTRLFADDGELVSMTPVMPGATEVVYQYAAPLPRRGLALARDITHPTKTLALLVSPNLSVRAPALRDDGIVRVGRGSSNRRYHRYSTRTLAKGAVVTATVDARRGNPLVRGGVVAAVCVLAAATVVYPLVRRRRRSPPDEPAALEEHALTPEGQER